MRQIINLLFGLLIFTACNQDEGTFIDQRDGKEYKWLKIGPDVWMAENLAYLPQVNSVLESSLEVPMFYVPGYNGTATNEAITFQAHSWDDSIIVPYEKYGVLYNWSAVMSGITKTKTNIDAICPSGWHVPTDEEWMRLELSLGIDPVELKALGMRSDNALGYLLKGKFGWNNGGNGIDTAKFNALPAGEAFSGAVFLEEGEKATFWTSTTGLFNSTAWSRSIFCCEDGILRMERDKMDGFSLRLVKDKD